MNRIFIPLFLLIGFFFGCNQSREVETIQTHVDFNTEWEFVKDMDTTITDGLFERLESELEWEQIRLPHTANIEPLVIEGQQWQGEMFYRKFFEVEPEMEGKHITLKFEGAMHEADIYLNGEKVGYNSGGYLPFAVNITDHLKFDEENVLLVKLNNENNSQIPPGKAIEVLDFNYYGGIYRDVYLIAKNQLRISDPIEANRVAAGGILVSYEDVSDNEATVSIQADIENDRAENANARLNYMLQDAEGNTVASAEAEIEIESGSNTLHTKKCRSKIQTFGHHLLLISTHLPYRCLMETNSSTASSSESESERSDLMR